MVQFVHLSLSVQCRSVQLCVYCTVTVYMCLLRVESGEREETSMEITEAEQQKKDEE